MDDLKNYYSNYISPSVTRVLVVGAIDQAKMTAGLNGLATAWKPKKVAIPSWPIAQENKTAKVFFFDVPDAKQSQLRIGYPALSVTDPELMP